MCGFIWIERFQATTGKILPFNRCKVFNFFLNREWFSASSWPSASKTIAIKPLIMSLSSTRLWSIVSSPRARRKFERSRKVSVRDVRLFFQIGSPATILLSIVSLVDLNRGILKMSFVHLTDIVNVISAYLVLFHWFSGWQHVEYIITSGVHNWYRTPDECSYSQILRDVRFHWQ